MFSRQREALEAVASRRRQARLDVCSTCSPFHARSRWPTTYVAHWFDVPALRDRTPDPARAPEIEDALRAAPRRETELLFEAVLSEQ